MDACAPGGLKNCMIGSSCFFINTVLLGLLRTSGILFVASLSRFNLSRGETVLPYALSIFVQNLSIPLAIFICKRFGTKIVTALGCILGAIGAGTCFFAEDMTTITVLWGLIVGVGFGLASATVPEFINQHFDSHRSKMTFIPASGAAFGSFILPPIVDLLLDVYGLSGSFLILCGFILNCIPAALLLRKSSIVVNDSNFSDSELNESKSIASETNERKSIASEITERKSIASEVRVKIYAADDISDRSDSSSSDDEFIKKVPRLEIEDASNHNLLLTYEEKIQRLSTQTLLSDYSVRLSCADALNVEDIIQRSKGRRKVDRNLLETEVLSLYSVDDDQKQNSKDCFLEKRIRFASVQYQKPISPGKFHQKITISSESVVSDTGKNFYEKTCNKSKNYDYHADADNDKHHTKLDAPSISVTHHNLSENNEELYDETDELYLKCPYNEHTEEDKDIMHGRLKSASVCTRHPSRCSETSEKELLKVRQKILCIVPLKDVETDNRSFSDVLTIVFDPMVILISLTNAVSSFTLICILTIIVDFIQDLDIHSFYGKHIIMTLSAAELIGLWCVQWVKELCMTFITETSFVCLCFACQGIFIAAIVWSSNALIIIFAAFYGLALAGLIITFPILMEKYIGNHKINIAVYSTKIVSGIFCLAIPPSVGYFRDQIGTYDYIFHGLSFLSAISCLAWTIVQYMAKFRRH